MLALACISAIKPAVSLEEASIAINKAFLAENPDCYADLHVEDDVLRDVLDIGEAAKVQEYTEKVKQSVARKDIVMRTRDKYAKTHFKRSDRVRRYSALQKKVPRWLPEQDKVTTALVAEWIEKYRAPDVAIVCDDYNGRWRVVAPTLDWRSISWTKRGHEKTAMEVLMQSWAYQKDWNGLLSPFSMDELAKELV